MAKIRITKEFSFDMAHALLNYDGLCRNVHGHTYKLAVTLIGSPIELQNDPKLGMVIDFSDLKTIVKQPIVDVFDHAIVLKEGHKAIPSMLELNDYGKTIVLPFQPTCENLVVHFVGMIKDKLPKGVTLFSLRLHETPTSYAEWFSVDNES
jgi:6-pyruvoyltetrahydropterin/6-carboxytetrahydropterin synthase